MEKGDERMKKVRKVLFLGVLLISLIFANTCTYAKDRTASYEMKMVKTEIKDGSGKVRGLVYYQYPEFKGKSTAIRKINKKLSSEGKKFLKSSNAKWIKERTDSAIKDNRFFDKYYERGYEQYFYKTSCKVTYNKNNIISMHMKEEWYAGGVNNQTDYGWTFDLKKGKVFTVEDVISGDAKVKILQAAKKYLRNSKFSATNEKMEDRVDYKVVKNTKLKDYKFYIKAEKVYICYGSYELGHGTGWDIFSLIGKYK